MPRVNRAGQKFGLHPHRTPPHTANHRPRREVGLARRKDCCAVLCSHHKERRGWMAIIIFRRCFSDVRSTWYLYVGGGKGKRRERGEGTAWGASQGSGLRTTGGGGGGGGKRASLPRSLNRWDGDVHPPASGSDIIITRCTAREHRNKKIRWTETCPFYVYCWLCPRKNWA